MRIQRARKILGKRGKKLTDNQISSIVNLLTFLCNKSLDELRMKHFDHLKIPD